MDVLQGAAGDLAPRLGAYSDRCLAAAEQLAGPADDLALPRWLLLQAAVEYRLKAYLVSARGGAPDTRDLTRLVSLARLCGLELSVEDLGLIERLASSAPAAAPSTLPAHARVAVLCRNMHGQQR